MLITFFDEQVVIHKQFVPEGQSIVLSMLSKNFPVEATISSRVQLVLAARQYPFPFHTGSEDISGQTRCCGDKPPNLFP
jgi:hypothetical protein